MNARPLDRSAARAAIAACAFAAGLSSQDLVRDLATGDRVAVESARRRALAAEDLPLDGLRQLLRSGDAQRRAAAASVLAARAPADAALAAFFEDERDPRVLEPLVGFLPDEALLAVLRVDAFTAPADGPDFDGEELEAKALRLRVRALGRAMERGLLELDPTLWGVLLHAQQPGFARAAARLLAGAAWPFPIEELNGLSPTARLIALEALADRPRTEAVAFAMAALADADLGAYGRSLALLALPDASSWPRDEVRALPGRLVDEDPGVRSRAALACDLLDEEQADRLVSAVHRLAMEGQDLDVLLAALERVGPRGERHLVGLARGLDDDARATIVDWLAERGSEVLGELLADAFEGRQPMSVSLLRRAGPLVRAEPARREAVLGILSDPDADPALRYAAFTVLVDVGPIEGAVLDFALDPEGEPVSRVRALLRAPANSLAPGSWRRVLAEAPESTLSMVLARMAESTLSEDVAEELVELASEGTGISDMAARACLIAAPSARAERVFGGLDAERRHDLAAALSGRTEPWVLEALRATPVLAGRDEVLFQRVLHGDRELLRELLAEPGTWDRRALRRLAEHPELLRPDDLPLAAAALLAASTEAATRRILVSWVARRRDLPSEELLVRLHREDPDEEVRYEALRGLLRRPGQAEAFRQRVEEAIPNGLDVDLRELAFEVLGAMERPLGPDAVGFLARLLVVAPLAHPDREIKAALGIEPVGDHALLHTAWQLLGRDVPASLGDALAAAVAEAQRHDRAFALHRARLGGLLALLAQDPKTRAAAGAVAEAILGAPDLDASFVGPAAVLLAEQAEAAQDYERAAALWPQALLSILSVPPPPLMLRAVVGDAWRAEGQLPVARIAAGAPLCAARAAMAAGEAVPLEWQLAAASLAVGDAETEAAVARMIEDSKR